MPVIKLKHVDKRNRDSDWLRQYANNKTSQHGQDGVIAKIFEVIGTKSQACCEFGAWDGKKASNTYSLIAEQGWEGYLIEGNPERQKDIIANHNNNPKAHAVHAWVDFEGENTIDQILARAGAPKDLDLMVIDIDGVDYHIWDSMKEYRPRVVAIEFNPTVPNDVIFIQDRDWRVYQGNSLLACIELGKSKGYELVSCVGDAFFVQEKYFPLFNISDNSADALYHYGHRQLKIFSGYDGMIYTAGHRQVGWGVGRTFEADALQVLPLEQRRGADRKI